MENYSGKCARCGYLNLYDKRGFASDNYYCTKERAYHAWSERACSSFDDLGPARDAMVEKARENRL